MQATIDSFTVSKTSTAATSRQHSTAFSSSSSHIDSNFKVYIDANDSMLTTRKFDDVRLLENCVKEIQEAPPEHQLVKNPPIKLYGKEFRQKRDVGFYSDMGKGYSYSGQTTPVNTFESFPSLKKLLDRINLMFDSSFDGILVNYYKNGEDKIARHNDKQDVDQKCGVVAISYGASRKFRVSDCQGKKLLDIPTETGQIIHMSGNFQKHYYHEVPLEKKVTQPRYSFTFRKHSCC